MNQVVSDKGTAGLARTRVASHSVQGRTTTELIVSSVAYTKGVTTMATTTIERVALSTDAIVKAEGIFAPSDGDIYARTQWVIGACDATHGNATGVAADVEAYYALQGRKAPRGYGRASIVNAGTNAKLWERTTLGNTSAIVPNDDPNGKPVKVGARQLVGKLDAARHAHGAKTVNKLIDGVLEPLSSDIDPADKYLAVMEALKALIEAPEAEKEKTDPTPTVAQIVALLIKAQEKADALNLSDLSDLIDAAIDSANTVSE